MGQKVDVYIQPGKPQQNAYIEQSHSRHEWLDQNIFENTKQAQEQATNWLWAYNNGRPTMAGRRYNTCYDS
jgi:putative transposase